MKYINLILLSSVDPILVALLIPLAVHAYRIPHVYGATVPTARLDHRVDLLLQEPVLFGITGLNAVLLPANNQVVPVSQ